MVISSRKKKTRFPPSIKPLVSQWLTEKRESAERGVIAARQACQLDPTDTSLRQLAYWQNVASGIDWLSGLLAQERNGV